ncbi:MAG: hypothetical protein R2700_05920 [Solirubrobacterales bacterium]
MFTAVVKAAVGGWSGVIWIVPPNWPEAWTSNGEPGSAVGMPSALSESPEAWRAATSWAYSHLPA